MALLCTTKRGDSAAKRDDLVCVAVDGNPMRVFERAIVIDEPWVSRVLRGDKAWEMRSKPTRHRGLLGIIRKGSGQVVGTALLLDSLQALSRPEFTRHEAEHRIPGAEQDDAFRRGWRFPWVLAEARALPRPVQFSHRSGQVIWVRLDDDADLAIQSALQTTKAEPESDKGRETPTIREHR